MSATVENALVKLKTACVNNSIKVGFEGCGGGQVVSVLPFFSDDPKSNPGNYVKSENFIFEKNETK